MSTIRKPSTFRESYDSQWFFPNGTLYTETHQANLINMDTYRIGTNVPNFRKKILAGENATSDMLAVEQSMSGTPAINNVKGAGDNPRGQIINTSAMNWFGALNVDESLVNTADNAARAKAYSNIRSGFQSIPFLGEIRETAAMIRRPASALRDLFGKYQDVARGLRSQAARSRAGRRGFAGAAADTWLEYSFGWKPLIMDVQEAYHAFSEVARTPAFVPFKATYRTASNTPRTFVNDQGIPGCGAGFYNFVTARQDTSVSYSGTAKVGVSAGDGLTARLGAGWPDFVPAAWELAPWSFLIDYFGNIGQILDSWATMQYTEFGFVSRTARSVLEITQDIVPHSDVNGVFATTSESPGVIRQTYKSVNRSSSFSVPLPSLQARVSLGGSRPLNIAALIVSQAADFSWSPRR